MAAVWFNPNQPIMNPPSRPETEFVCRQCGQPEAQAVGDEILCLRCYHERGSCGAVREDDAGQSVVPGLQPAVSQLAARPKNPKMPRHAVSG